jgi:hypothetical protein
MKFVAVRDLGNKHLCTVSRSSKQVILVLLWESGKLPEYLSAYATEAAAVTIR